MTIAVGDTVTWRSGKTAARERGKHVEPLGVANCQVMEFGKTGDGKDAAIIRLPGVFKNQEVAALVSDLEA